MQGKVSENQNHDELKILRFGNDSVLLCDPGYYIYILSLIAAGEQLVCQSTRVKVFGFCRFLRFEPYSDYLVQVNAPTQPPTSAGTLSGLLGLPPFPTAV